MDVNITQAELNLAINYMVIERVARCMGVYEYWADEYEGIEAVFSEARKGSLLSTFKGIGAGGLQSLTDTFNVLGDLTGLPLEVLSGERQITLGLVVDETKPHAVDLSKMSMDELNDYIENRVVKAKGYQSMYAMIPWLNDVKAEWQINALITEQIGTVKAGKEVHLAAEITKWAANPLGLNTLGLYVYLLEEGYIHINAAQPENIQSNINNISSLLDQIEEEIENIYDKHFSNISTTPKKSPKNKDKEAIWGYITNWKQNIYSIDSIIYSMIRNMEIALEGTPGNKLGRTERKVLDKKGVAFPVPLVWGDRGSDLWNLFDHILKQGYAFSFSYMQLIEESTIVDEIKHHEEDILPILESKQEIFEQLLNGDSLTAQHRSEIQNKLSLVEQEIDDIRNFYLRRLSASQKLFDTNKRLWLAVQRQSIQVMKSAINITAGMTEEEKADVARKHAELDALMQRIEYKANLTGAKAWTKVRNPYYKYTTVPAKEDEETKKAKKTKTAKKTKKNKKTDKEAPN